MGTTESDVNRHLLVSNLTTPIQRGMVLANYGRSEDAVPGFMMMTTRIMMQASAATFRNVWRISPE